MAHRLRRQRGFTLVEAVMVIVIIGVIGGMVAVFIRAPLQSYSDNLARAELSDVADLALRRMARDLRLALPNSIRVNQGRDSLEFLLTRSGGRYLAAEDAVDTLPVLDFLDPANKTLAVVGPMPAASPGDYFAVNNLGAGFTPADAYAYELGPSLRNISKVAGVDAGNRTLTLADNPFAVQAPPSPSPLHRFFIVSGPVTYYCGLEADGKTRLLTRQSGYPIKPDQVTNPVPVGGSGTRSLFAGRVNRCSFEYKPADSNLRRSALVVLTLELQPRNSTDAVVRLVHQVHVDNAP